MRIYLDYASLTPIDPKVAKVIAKYSSAEYMNPSSLHADGVASKRVVDTSRTYIASYVGAHWDEIIFTGSGTEANNLAIIGACKATAPAENGKGHIIVSAIEHASVLEPVKSLLEWGFEVTYVPVDARGVIDTKTLKKSLRPNTVLVSVMMVNNEIGAVQPIKDVAKIVRDHRKATGAKTLLHTDACQAPLYVPLSMEKLGVDLMTLDSHKIYGPRGIGMLYVRRGVKLAPIIYGGGQENGLRSGTENVPAIAGFAEAMNLAVVDQEKSVVKIDKLKNLFFKTLQSKIPDISVNGDIEDTFHILNLNIPNVDGEFLVLELDAAGISASTKSSCLRDEDESYVLKAIGVDSATSIRFSFGKFLSTHDVKKAARITAELIKRQRDRKTL